MMNSLLKLLLIPLTSVIILSGCDSSSSSGSTTLTGTAATGAPVAGTVTVIGAGGMEETIATGSNGSFTLDVSALTAPYMLRITPTDTSIPTMYSFAETTGTVNLTPATSLAVYLAAEAAGGSTDLDAMYANWDGTAVTPAQITAANTTVVANLQSQIEAAGITASTFDIFTTPFSADGSGFDGVLDDLSITVDDTGGTYTLVDVNTGTIAFDDTLSEIIDTVIDATGGGIDLVTVSGNTHTLSGTYSSACYSSDSINGQIDFITVVGTTWTTGTYMYSGVTNCSSTPDANPSTATGTAVVGSTMQIAGWVHNGDVAPLADDGSGSLSNTETVTRFDVTVSSATGDYAQYIGQTVGVYYVIDDTATAIILYRDADGGYTSSADPLIQ